MDHALAVAGLGLPVFPLAPLSKTPLLRDVNWQDIATTDENTILEWFRKNPSANYGIACGPKADLLVIDTDSKEGESWYRSHGFPDDAIVQTPSGGRHFYYRTENADIQTNAKKIFPGVDVRASGGYVVGPGSMLGTGTYRGSLANIPDAPAELIAILPERQTYTYVIPEGEKVEVASETERRQLNSAIRDLEGIPRVWAPGAGWHDTVFRVACWLSRMVNHPAYALTEDAALTILLTHAPTYPQWDESNIIIEWEDAKKRTVGQGADTPIESTPEFLPLVETMALLPDVTTKGEAFTGLMFNTPSNPSPSKLADMRHTLIVEAFRAGLTDVQVATLAWSAKVSEGLQAEPQGLQKLWREVEEGKLASMRPAAVVVPATPELRVGRKLVLLTAAEREHRRSGVFKWFGDTYMNWAESAVTVMNAPYHRMNRWAILTLVYSTLGVIALAGGVDLGLNLYMLILGETTTGKSESVRLMKSVLRAYFNADDNPDMGGNATSITLLERLIERDGKATLYRKDEAHGMIYEMKNTSYMKDMPTTLTELYDGDVPTFHRAGRKDTSGVEAKTFFSIHFMGTLDGMTGVIEGSDWESGWMNRFVWAVGDKHERTRESMGMKFRTESDPAQSNAMQMQWAAEFRANERVLRRPDGNPNNMVIPSDVYERWLDMKEYLLIDVAANHRYANRLIPTFERFSTTVMKCACLVALSERQTTVSMDHMLVAIEQAEEWINNIIMMVERTDETPFIRDVNAVERLIASQPGNEMRIEQVYQHSPREKTKDTDELIRKLVSERRVLEYPTVDESKILRINPQQLKEAA